MSPPSSVLTWRSCGQRSLAGYSPRGGTVNTTEQAHTHSPLDAQGPCTSPEGHVSRGSGIPEANLPDSLHSLSAPSLTTSGLPTREEQRLNPTNPGALSSLKASRTRGVRSGEALGNQLAHSPRFTAGKLRPGPA